MYNILFHTECRQHYPGRYHVSILQSLNMSVWPSGLRRQTQGEKPCFLIGSENEISGPLMRAGVRIPFLTTTIFGRTFPVCRRWIFCPCKSLSLGI